MRNQEFNLHEYGKVPPQAVDIEEALLGMLIEYPVMDNAVSLLAPEYFYKEAHQIIYSAILTLYRNEKAIDTLTVLNQLKTTGELEIIGGGYYISKLNASMPTSLDEYCIIVFQKYLARELIRIGNEATKEAFEDTTDILETYENIKQQFDTIDESIINLRKPKSWEDHLLIFGEETDKKIKLNRDGKPIGIPTGIKELNRLLNGWQPSDLIILASRPSMGKTSLALFFAKVAARYGCAVDIYSLEMSSERLVQRMVLGETEVSGGAYNKGFINSDQLTDITAAMGNIAAWKINLSEDSNATIDRIKATSRINHNKGKCDLIIIDYLQLIEPEKNLSSREREISTMARKLKQLAINLNVPIILLSQLNRACESRTDKRPMLSDLRESGAIEQDADIVLFPFRPFYYTKYPEDEGKIEMNISKNRNGSTGKIEFYHNADICNFFDEMAIVGENVPF